MAPNGPQLWNVPVLIALCFLLWYCDWFTEVNDRNAKFARSGKGYVTGKLAIEWLQAFGMAKKEGELRARHTFSS